MLSCHRRRRRHLAACMQARTVHGFEPEGIHITQWTHSSVLVSWQTGRESEHESAAV
jgi:hypothetical protein